MTLPQLACLLLCRWGRARDLNFSKQRNTLLSGASYLRSFIVPTEEVQPISSTAGEESIPPASAAVPAPASQAAPVERWLAEHGDVLWRFVLGRVRSRETAEEVVQDTLLAAMQSYGAYSGGASERTWLLAIAAHKAIDHFRASRRRAGKAAENVDPDAADSEDWGDFTSIGSWARPPKAWGAGWDGGDGGATENAELLAALRSCIESLPPSQAEAVWLRDILDTPAAQVCEAMGISPTNLWSRMHRARAALRRCVEKTMGLRMEGTR